MDRMSGEENAWGERAAWLDELTSPVDCNRQRPFPGRSLDVQMREKMEAILPSRSYDMTNTRDGGGRRRGMRRRQVQASRKRATRPWCAILNGRMHRQQRWDLDAARRRRDGRIGVPSRLRVLCTEVRLPAFSQLSGQLRSARLGSRWAWHQLIICRRDTTPAATSPMLDHGRNLPHKPHGRSLHRRTPRPCQFGESGL